MARSGSCVTTTVSGQQPVKTCPGASGPDSIADLLQRIGDIHLTARQLTAVNDLFGATNSTGLVVSHTDGQWFVNPARTILTAASTLLGGLKDGDLLALVSIGN